MTAPDYDHMRTLAPDAMRGHIRSGAWQGQTAGFAPGRLQANLVILQGDWADQFLEFCARNPKPCPLVGLSAKRGDPRMPMLGDIDIRTDVPSYNVYRQGQLEGTVPDISDIWTDDMVAFALGCSFTFERALLEAGIRLKHIENNTTVPMFATGLPLDPVGPFHGNMVVSMRPMSPANAERARAITADYDHAHGDPVHIGDPGAIGIADAMQPDWGDPAEFQDGDTPVFWACGVTPQNVLAQARPPLCITHTPGTMLVTDAPEERMPDFERRIM